jgi:methylglutamate dehydrogenase subunit B
MSEYWYHGGGCRSWLVVRRSTLTHEILSVAAAPGTGAAVVDVAMAKAGAE